MQQVLNIKNATGIGQEALAGFLGISRQALRKAEKGWFSLSTANLIKLGRLQECFDSTNKKIPALLPGKYIHDEKREAECHYLASLAQKQLADAEVIFQKNLQLYQALEMMEAENEADLLWIKKTKKDILKKLDKCGTATCMRLRKRIYLLIAEADYIRRLVNENQSNHENP